MVITFTVIFFWQHFWNDNSKFTIFRTTAIPTQSEISRLNQIANSISVIINEVTEITETTSLVTTSAPITTTKSTTFQIPQQKQDNKQYVRSESQWNPPFVSQRPHNPIPKVISSTTITTANNPSTLRSTNSFTSSVTSTTGGVSKIIVIQKPPRVAIDRFLPSSRDRRIKVQRYSPSPTILYSQSAPKTLLDHWEFQTEEKPSGSTTRAFTSRFTSLIVPVTVLCLYSLIYFWVKYVVFTEFLCRLKHAFHMLFAMSATQFTISKVIETCKY